MKLVFFLSIFLKFCNSGKLIDLGNSVDKQSIFQYSLSNKNAVYFDTLKGHTYKKKN